MSDSKELRFYFRHGYNLALLDAENVVTRLAQLPRATSEEKTALYYAADVIRKKTKMDNDSAESKEVDAALLAQCTCGGVAGGRSCGLNCAIFSGCDAKVGRSVEALWGTPMTAEQVKENRAAGKMQHFTEIGAPHAASLDKELVDKAQEFISKAINYIQLQGKHSRAHFTEENLNLLRMAIDTPKPVMHDDIKECPECESTEITESEVEKDSSLFEGANKIEVKYKVHLRTCAKCDLGWLDYRAEEAEMQALYKALYKEVVRLRELVKDRDREILRLLSLARPT